MKMDSPYHQPSYKVGTLLHRRSPEELVGFGFRLWIGGHKKNDFDFWKKSWDFYSRELGTESAKVLVTELACWAQILLNSADRELQIAPQNSTCFCHDECMAISLISACQNNACPVLKACAMALMGDEANIDTVIEASYGFAHELSGQNINLANSTPNTELSFAV